MTVEGASLSIMRLVVLTSALRAACVSPMSLWPIGLMGASLVQVSSTGLCLVVMLLQRMKLSTRGCLFDRLRLLPSAVQQVLSGTVLNEQRRWQNQC